MCLLNNFNSAGDLPENLFFESGGQLPCNTKPTKRNAIIAQQQADESIKSKNQTVEFCVLTETCANISNTIIELKSVKRRLQKEFYEASSGTREEAKKRMDNYFTSKDRESNKENEDDDSCSDIDEEPDSQESLLEDILQCKLDIDTQKEVMSVAKSSLKKKSKYM